MIPNSVLNEIIKKVELHHCDLNTLKDNFIFVINSKRQYSLIKTKNQFVKTIVKRKNCIQNLVKLGNLLNDNYFEKLNFFENHHYSPYRDSNSHHLFNPKPCLPEPVIELISSSIGIKWQSLARSLGLREGVIDQLEYDYFHEPNLKIRKMLEMFQSKCQNTKMMQTNLLKGLDNSRRKDLREQVEELFMNISLQKI